MAKRAAAGNRKKEAGWRKHVSVQAGSGLSVGAYCRRNGLRGHSFYWWRRELARRDAEQPPGPVAFVPVTVASQMPVSTEEGRIEIVLAGDRRVRVEGSVDRQMLADVLSVLEEREGRRGETRC